MSRHSEVSFGTGLRSGSAGEPLGQFGDCCGPDVFDSLGKHRARAVTDAENHPAANLFRRLGFRREAHFVEHVWYKGAWGSEFVFAMLQCEWRK